MPVPHNEPKPRFMTGTSNTMVLTGRTAYHLPASITVTALDEKDRLFKLSNRGKYIALAAPGVDIIVLAPNNSGDMISGTSVAAAHITGVAALAIARNNALDAKSMRKLLRATAVRLKQDPTLVGAGRADALRAVQEATK